ncbi:MAG TPA: UbiD family decarboxylase [bacterium]|nr:UbiD family decarboxylase [bacterium]HNO90886.1 UbiD family decarboxylase [bacterium]
MMYKNLSDCIADLERNGHLIRVNEEVDPYLEMAEIQRRVYQKQGPALLFTRVKGCRFPAVSNLFGTMDRTRFMFRHTLAAVQKLIELKVDPANLAKRPLRYAGVPFSALTMLPWKKSNGAVLKNTCRIGELPQITCWPKDGGPFVTLPQVYSEHPDHPGWKMSNLGMYRIQLAGNQYIQDREVGGHYQIHRGIGVHHAAAIRRGEKLRVSIFVGGPPAHTLAAVMPLPEGLSELMFAGVLTGRRFRYGYQNGHAVSMDADFVITGTIDTQATKPEGPFGDHLGYYSLTHDYPYIEVEQVYHRDGAVWPFTVVGRPPQEDTSFGDIIHEITGPVIPTVIAGLHGVNAVDGAGVHPLLLAIGSERYVPYGERKPQELLTIANAILGQGQLSLAKYLFITAKEDDPSLDVHDIPKFLQHVLSRVRWEEDLHFQTRTTIDTLDYSGFGFNQGSKVVIASAGKVRRLLASQVPSELKLPEGFSDAHVILPGIVAVRGAQYSDRVAARKAIRVLCEYLEHQRDLENLPLWIVCDDVTFVKAQLNNFLWVTFTRSDPAADMDGAGAFVEDKHWGCRGPLVIDARIKPHHAPPLIEDPDVTRRVDALAEKGKSLYGII